MQEVLQLAESLIGRIPYNLNSFDPTESGFNCLGLVHWTCLQSGIHVPTDWTEAAAMGFEIARKDMRPGDVIVIPNSEGWIKKYHLPNHFMLVTEHGLLHIGRKDGLAKAECPYHDNWQVRRISS